MYATHAFVCKRLISDAQNKIKKKAKYSMKIYEVEEHGGPKFYKIYTMYIYYIISHTPQNVLLLWGV